MSRVAWQGYSTTYVTCDSDWGTPCAEYAMWLVAQQGGASTWTRVSNVVSYSVPSPPSPPPPPPPPPSSPRPSHCCYGRRDVPDWAYTNWFEDATFNETFVCDGGLRAVEEYLASSGSDPDLVTIETDIDSLRAKRDSSHPCHELHYLDVGARQRSFEPFSCGHSNWNVAVFSDADIAGRCSGGCAGSYLTCHAHPSFGRCTTLPLTLSLIHI